VGYKRTLSPAKGVGIANSAEHLVHRSAEQDAEGAQADAPCASYGYPSILLSQKLKANSQKQFNTKLFIS